MKFQVLNKKRTEAAASLIEYTLLIALILLIAIPSIQYGGESVEQRINHAATALEAGGVVVPCDPLHPDWPNC